MFLCHLYSLRALHLVSHPIMKLRFFSCLIFLSFSYILDILFLNVFVGHRTVQVFLSILSLYLNDGFFCCAENFLVSWGPSFCYFYLIYYFLTKVSPPSTSPVSPHHFPSPPDPLPFLSLQRRPGIPGISTEQAITSSNKTRHTQGPIFKLLILTPVQLDSCLESLFLCQ